MGANQTRLLANHTPRGCERMEQKRRRGDFVKKTVCEIGLEDWAVWDVEVREQSQGGWKDGAEEKRHKV